jgi:hypothetical protein
VWQVFPSEIRPREINFGPASVRAAKDKLVANLPENAAMFELLRWHYKHCLVLAYGAGKLIELLSPAFTSPIDMDLLTELDLDEDYSW